MINIRAKTIAHSKQRYDTVGDYYKSKKGNITEFRVSDLDNEKYEMCVLIHELVEYALVRARGIPLNAIDEFDIAFEARREAGNTDEPGDSPMSPYYKEHNFATLIEKLLAKELGVNWMVYEKVINTL